LTGLCAVLCLAIWSTPLPAAAGSSVVNTCRFYCRFWLPLLVAASGCRFWLPLLVAASGCRFAGPNHNVV
jgi:hypothetical protein